MGSKFLASVLGWYFIITSLFLVLRRDRVVAAMKELMGQQGLMLVSGMISLIIGLLMVLSHNIWIMNWPIVITLLSWLILLGGLCRLFCPETVYRIWKKMIQNPEKMVVLAAIMFLLGLFLLYQAYWGWGW